MRKLFAYFIILASFLRFTESISCGSPDQLDPNLLSQFKEKVWQAKDVETLNSLLGEISTLNSKYNIVELHDLLSTINRKLNFLKRKFKPFRTQASTTNRPPSPYQRRQILELETAKDFGLRNFTNEPPVGVQKVPAIKPPIPIKDN